MKSLLALVFLTVTLAAQVPDLPKPFNAAHYPRVLYAEVPMYPPVALTARFEGKVEVQAVIEKGTVVRAESKLGFVRARGKVITDNPKLLEFLAVPSIENVKTWRFDASASGTLFLTYEYRIEGRETNEPQSPRVEMNLPTSVTVIAKPIKPTCSGCQ